MLDTGNKTAEYPIPQGADNIYCNIYKKEAKGYELIIRDVWGCWEKVHEKDLIWNVFFKHQSQAPAAGIKNLAGGKK